jgi:transcriptional antiterminator NusG
MAKQWYALHTYSGQEQKAKRHLESMIANEGLEDYFGEIVIPTEEVTEMKQGKRSTITKKFLPSYLLMQVVLDKRTEQFVVNTPGESKREVEIDEVPWRAGDQVKVIDGPFADFSGFVSEINLERKKVKVMVSIFGRPTPVELDFLQIESV